MALYRYRAVDPKGTVAEGTMEESSARRVTAILEERGFQVSEVDRVAKRLGLLSLGRRLKLEDLELFNEHLMAVTRSRLPLAPALKGIIKDLRNRRLRPILEKIRVDLEQGSSLDEALAKHPDSFPPLYVTAVRAGERAGNLSGVLAALNTHSSRMIEIRNTLQAAAAYPVMVMLCAACLLAFLSLKVIPVFAEIFSDFGSSLPAPTQFVVDVSGFFVRHLSAIVWLGPILAVGLLVALKFARRTESGRFVLDWIKHYVPIVGKTYVQGSLARFSRSLSILLSGGVPIVESLDLAAAAAGNGVLRRNVQHATVHVAGGERVADALQNTGYFSHTFCWLFSTGEQRGEMDEALVTIADTYEREIARRDKLYGFLFAPFLVLVVGGLIGFLVVALYLPIFTLGDAIGM